MGRRKRIEDVDVLTIAREIFIREGASGATREIASRAGISEAALFKRFPTKAQLFTASMAPPNVDAEGLIARAAAAEDPVDAICGLAAGMLAYFREAIPVILRLTQNPLIDLHSVRRQFGVGPEQRLAQAVPGFLQHLADEGRIACPDPRAAAGLLIAAMHSLALFEIMDAPEHADADVRRLVLALWAGLAPHPQK